MPLIRFMIRFVLAIILCLPLSAATVTLTNGVPAVFAFDSITDPLDPPIVIPLFEYTAAGPSTIRITDVGYSGDAFRFTIDGVPYFTSRNPGPSDIFGFSFEQAWADPYLDHGIAYVGPGYHTIQIEVIAESFNTRVSNDAIGYIIADEGVPEPASVLTVVSALAGLVIMRRRGRTEQAL